ncbi:MAG: hypothetical protein ABI794_02240 [Betaproteobacteria bacterium]
MTDQSASDGPDAAGGATAAEALHPGAFVEAKVQHLGRVAFSVKG